MLRRGFGLARRSHDVDSKLCRALFCEFFGSLSVGPVPLPVHWLAVGVTDTLVGANLNFEVDVVRQNTIKFVLRGKEKIDAFCFKRKEMGAKKKQTLVG